MRHAVKRILVPLLALGILGPSTAEVSIDQEADASARSVVLMYELMAGGDDGAPWPIMRLHIPSIWALNAEGSTGPTPDGWPSLAWDPIADAPEVTWCRYDGTDYEIVVSRWNSGHWTEPETLTSNAVDDEDPELAYAPDGTARITYWSGGEVYWLTRPPSGTWSAPEPVDAGTESSVTGCAEELVAYQHTVTPSEVDIVVAERDGTWIPTAVATTNFTGLDGNGDIDVRLHTSSDRIWVDWEDTEGSLGWCRRQQGGWSPPHYEPIAGPEDEEAGRLRIQHLAAR